jgi:regulator of sirC expression with transglutaminase-like and TPR domain
LTNIKHFNENDVTRVKSLINLLDDEDNSIYIIVRDNLISMGEVALPLLESHLQTNEPLLQERVKEAYEVITSAILKEQIRAYREKYKEEMNLEEGVLLIAKYGYPQIDMRTFSDLLNFFASELQGRLDFADPPEEIAVKVGKYFSEEKGFSGKEIDYYDSDYHYIHKVIETKKGVPISLCVIYLLVLKRLNLPVKGIGMPGHFIIRYEFGTKHILADPFHAGKILTLEDCKNYLTRMGYAFNNEYLDPVSDKQILERMIRNLIMVFEKQNQSAKVQTFLQCIDILNVNP